MSFEPLEAVEADINHIIGTYDRDPVETWQSFGESCLENARSARVEASIDKIRIYLDELTREAPEETEPITAALEYIEESYHQDGGSDWNCKSAEVLEDFACYVLNKFRIDAQGTMADPS